MNVVFGAEKEEEGRPRVQSRKFGIGIFYQYAHQQNGYGGRGQHLARNHNDQAKIMCLHTRIFDKGKSGHCYFSCTDIEPILERQAPSVGSAPALGFPN